MDRWQRSWKLHRITMTDRRSNSDCPHSPSVAMLASDPLNTVCSLAFSRPRRYRLARLDEEREHALGLDDISLNHVWSGLSWSCTPLLPDDEQLNQDAAVAEDKDQKYDDVARHRIANIAIGLVALMRMRRAMMAPNRLRWGRLWSRVQFWHDI